MYYLIYDTETTGIPANFDAPLSDSDNWPRLVQLAWQLHNEKGELIENHNLIVKPDGFDIPFNAIQIHGITNEIAHEKGLALSVVLQKFFGSFDLENTLIIGHNIQFDISIVGAEMHREGMDFEKLTAAPTLDTARASTEYCALPGGRGGKFKYPKLGELHQRLFGDFFDEAHNAAADVNATARSFFELVRLGVISPAQARFSAENFKAFKNLFPSVIAPYPIDVGQQIAEKEAALAWAESQKIKDKNEVEIVKNSPYFHFHNHSSFSILSATTTVENLIKKAVELEMPAVGITDMGNLMGAFHFVQAIRDKKDVITPIIGCEVYVSERYRQHKFTKDNPDRRHTQVLLAKNKAGYHNLSKISSIGYIEGYYAGFPRVSKEVILKYKENLIATTGSISSEIPDIILNVGEKNAEEAFLWWKEHFGEDFYVELIRHGLPEENHVNEILIKFARKYNVKILAQNNTYYINQSDAKAHDILLCVRDGEKVDTPIGRGRGYRFGFPNDEFYFKTASQMEHLFEDIPEAIQNLKDFVKKFEFYDLKQDVLLPKFKIPKEFEVEEDLQDDGVRGENAYLKHLTYEGAKKRYGIITEEIQNRLDFELETIANTGYPGYFLIVQDFTSQARKMGVSVGPGRGSAAGSAVAYCIGITNIDPIKYDLLFERFLNPERVSLPDIDIDFDDRGRDEIIRWVINKYGKDQVAQIITYGTMAGKSAIRDTARVLDLPLADSNKIAKKVHTKLNKLFKMDDKSLSEKFNGDELKDLQDILEISKRGDLEATTIQQAKVIEGSIRNTGVHACGVIITPKDIKELIPVAIAKDSDMAVTQFDNSVVENAGLLKMDFLGLKTLSIIKDAVHLVKKTKEIELIPDDFPLEDPLTYQEIFQKGKTVGIFQYESPGMQKHLKDLKPDKFDDLIAMNALYRPGPLAYIPNFIDRKHGIEEISYDLPEMEEYLAETYGITVYQEQVMLLSQKLANFTRGEADVLRKAMGKKQMDTLAKMEGKFIQNAIGNGHPENVLKKIWEDWKAFAQYAFNKSHSTCYAYVAFQTAYLKAHHPAEFMAAVLSNNMKDIKEITNFMQECKRMDVPVLSPDVNESSYDFTVNKNGAVRFGLGAIKGVGSAAVESIIQERNENGKFADVFDFIERIDQRVCNKKTLENLIYAGAFDELDQYHRAQYFFEDHEGVTNLEKIIKYGNAASDEGNENQISLFDVADMEVEMQKPMILDCPAWPIMYQLNKEKEVVGIYISSHPLDRFQVELNHYKNIDLITLKERQKEMIDKTFTVGGLITEVQHLVSAKNGKEFGKFILEDYTDSFEFMLFGEEYLRLRHFLEPNRFVLLQLHVNENKFSKRIYTNIKNINLLDDLIEKRAKSIEFHFEINEINEELIKNLLKIIQNNGGDKNLFLNLRDEKTQNVFASQSRKFSISITKDLIDELKRYEIDNYKLN
ncbi:DNA polymerase III subunit alpha [Candidatus Ornithobacterium hominis]|uniref:DNA polymerase III subunit alpha n=1 Tax=Candidatus Ornithobacterium hominis TaxID=2497989 RepID=UPI000E5A4018|nr:DNA polymerase III subunit alpha [Candidatus Ornithobacterium hominis]SZD73815.1 DNA polymerase III subunit alpha [Candidatus Ornithobacterium hominis]